MATRSRETGTSLARRLARGTMAALLLAGATLALPNVSLEAQEEAPEAFVPTEKLPVDSAVSFPVDI